MSTLNPPKKISKKHELREDKVVTFYARAWQYFDQNRTLVYGILAGIVLVAVAIVGYVFYQSRQSERANELLGQIVGLYEQGSYQEALDGTDDRVGLLEIADEYGSTDAGNLAHFYAADALFQLGEYDRALEHFDEFDKSEDFIGASAIAGQAAVYENKGEYSRAGDHYRRAALHFENELNSPQYLLDAGRSYELAGDFAEAQEVYEMIRDDYPESNLATNIEVYIARAAARQKS
ncbi:MAG: tetratricopeptide repeat protein [Rhodothermales bacterium]